MKTRTLLAVIVTKLLFLVLPPTGWAAEPSRLNEVFQLAGQGKTEEALAEVRIYVEELRESGVPADHPTMAYGLMAQGRMAHLAEEHEEAVTCFQQGLPVISAKLRPGSLWLDEFDSTLLLAQSLRELKRGPEAVEVLRVLLKRTREELARKPADLGIKRAGDDPGPTDVETMTVQEDWLVRVLTPLGNLQLVQKNWADAEQFLREAETLLERLQPEKKPELVALREGWERAARAQGKNIRPRLVGRFGHPRGTRIEGARLISEEEIYSAMMASGVVVLSSHPSDELDQYLKILQKCMHNGYRQAGFPDAKVVVGWEEPKDAVVIKVIDEGVRYRMGEIRIEGAKLVSEEILRGYLLEDPDKGGRRQDRETRSFLSFDKEKRLPEKIVKEASIETFPWLAASDDHNQTPTEAEIAATEWTNFMNQPLSETAPSAPWEPGEWIDCRAAKGNIGRALQKAYSDQARPFAKIEVTLVPKAAEGLMDLRVTIEEEGSALTVGTIHIMGNKVNTREDLLEFLAPALKEGQPLSGRYQEQVRRRLFESGRFLGWDLVTQPTKGSPNHVDVLLLVAEHWEAPPVLAPLTREQEAMLKFARWFNAAALEESDLVLSAELEVEDVPVQHAELVISSNGFGVSASLGGGARVWGTLELDHLAEFIVLAGEGSVSGSVPFGGTRPAVNIFAVETVGSGYTLEGPPGLAKTGGFSMGGGFSSLTDGEVFLGFDPATALAALGSLQGVQLTFEGTQAVVRFDEGITLRFEEDSGRLGEMRWEASPDDQGDPSEVTLLLKAEEEGLQRFQNEGQALREGVPKLALDNLSSLSLAGAASLLHLRAHGAEDIFENEPSAALSLIGKGMQRWAPLAAGYGNILDGILNFSSPDDNNFTFPLDPEDWELLQGSNNLMIFLGMGGYEMIASFVEPGTWPDQVLRELLFFLGGKPQYLNETVQNLLQDDSMGPFGCMVCSSLLRKTGHGATRAFAEKARETMNRRGFEKDWTMVLRGTAGDQAPGWALLQGLSTLEVKDLRDLLPDGQGEAWDALVALLEEVHAIAPTTTADALAPVIGRLWDAVEPEAIKSVDSYLESLTPQADPRLVAATVKDGEQTLPLLRKVPALMEQKIAPVLELTAIHESWLEESLDYLLFANELWKKDMFPNQEMVLQVSQSILKSLGPDGAAQVEKLGLNKQQYELWIATLMTANSYRMSLLQNPQITEREVRAFYDRRPDLFGDGGGKETRVYKIDFQIKGDGAKERALAERIRKDVAAVGNIEAMRTAFQKEASKHHSQAWARDDKGDYGWITPSNEFDPPLANMIAKMPDQSLSEVFEARVGKERFLYLVLIPEARRPGRAKPFKAVKRDAMVYAVIAREAKRLRGQVEIEYLEEPTPENPALAMEDQDPGVTLAGFPWKSKSTDHVRDHEEVRKLAMAGSAPDLFLLGMHAERGVGETTGIEAAIVHYQAAAAGGERRAMRRLAEIHRTGRGSVPRDEEKEKMWRDKAAAQAE